MDYKLLRDSSTGAVVTQNLRGMMRFKEHVEPQGYLTNAVKVGEDPKKGVMYALYISTRPLSRSERDVYISKCHGKMAGVLSINVNPTLCDYCKKMNKCEGAICSKCYSYKTLVPTASGKAASETMRGALTRNTYLLNKPLEKIPKINKPFFRFSAHGDLTNEQHFLNLIMIAEANPKTRFSLWTKQVGLVQDVLSRVKKPKNLHLIKSTTNINVAKPTLPEGFDKVFSVYTQEYADANGIKINCGAKSCASCMICYSDKFNRVKFVNELVK